MTVESVPAEHIEAIVGAVRHDTLHIGRAVSADRRVFILHSVECKEKHGADLALCKFSKALAYGITEDEWPMDTPVPLRIVGPRLLPQIPTPSAGGPMEATAPRLEDGHQ